MSFKFSCSFTHFAWSFELPRFLIDWHSLESKNNMAAKVNTTGFLRDLKSMKILKCWGIKKSCPRSKGHVEEISDWNENEVLWEKSYLRL